MKLTALHALGRIGAADPIIIRRNQHQVLTCRLTRPALLVYMVRASNAVDVHLVDHVGLATFKQDGTIPHAYAGQRGLQYHGESVQLPPGQYHLVIVNWTDEDVAVVCSVSW